MQQILPKIFKSYMSIIIVTLFSLSFLGAIHAEEGHCIWYGQCNQDFMGSQNCNYTGEAKLLNGDGLEILARHCPHMVTNGRDVKTCCDLNQLKTLDANIKLLAGFLSRCPNCYDNLVKHLCDLTCSPHQSSFMNDTKIEKNPTTNNTYVKAVDLFITNKYLQETFTSCSKVFVPSLGQLALSFMCGEWGASKCTPQRWFTYMGDSINNLYVPFQVNYNATDTKFGSLTPLDPKTTPCDQTLNENSPACSCVDCESSCPVPLPASPTKIIDSSLMRSIDRLISFFSKTLRTYKHLDQISTV